MNAAANTAINPNDFIVIPSSLKCPDAGSAPPMMNGVPAVPPRQKRHPQTPVTDDVCGGNYA
ncbi:hypothetical protein [Dyella acidiphila]|uniref:Uncharacterized protein n=1 Tax=Dyella acidiphila TaxID=2775866 RepID=A0ABR9GFA0_9GAMM|nr:hypothetical protein [Dyella acidiphila]MBE1162703.1 hypothetical protein [Dyella acidiphila]